MAEQSIGGLLQDEELGKIALPNIQREFVWANQKARDLVDSLYKKFPIGVILLWRSQDVKDLWRILQSQEKIKTPDWLILDGQQRITSLSLIKKGNIKIRFHLDKEIFEIESKKMINDPKWIRIDDIWTKSSMTILEELSKKLKITADEFLKRYKKQIQQIEEILTQDIPVFYIRENDYSKITEIYTRLNETGTKLKKAEINLAQIVLRFPTTFYKKLKKTVDDFEDWGLDANFFLRCFVCVSTNQSKYEPLRKYLEEADEDKVLKNLDVISENLHESFKFIISHFGINRDTNQHLIPSDIAIIPLMMYMIKNNSRVASAKELNKITLWFYCASHYGRFSTSTESTLNEDLREFKDSDPVKKWLENIRKERGDLKMRELRGRINKTKLFALYYALRQNEALDWWQGTKIDNTSKIESHHIFPKKVLRDAGFPDNLINDIRNIAIVSQKANRKINAMFPETYFDTEIEDRSRLFSQFVPEDPKYWKIENYKEFLEKREEIIINTLNKKISELEKSI